MDFTKNKSDDKVVVTGKRNARLGTIEKSPVGVPFFRAESSAVPFRIDDLFEIAFAMAAMLPEKDITISK